MSVKLLLTRLDVNKVVTQTSKFQPRVWESEQGWREWIHGVQRRDRRATITMSQTRARDVGDSDDRRKSQRLPSDWLAPSAIVTIDENHSIWIKPSQSGRLQSTAYSKRMDSTRGILYVFFSPLTLSIDLPVYELPEEQKERTLFNCKKYHGQLRMQFLAWSSAITSACSYALASGDPCSREVWLRIPRNSISHYSEIDICSGP
jgi:hypothetical protein